MLTVYQFAVRRGVAGDEAMDGWADSSL